MSYWRCDCGEAWSDIINRNCPDCGKSRFTTAMPVRCETCEGEGKLEVPAPQRDDPYYCRVIPCGDCNGNGWL